MGRQTAVVLYVLALVAVVVGVDVLFFRNRFWERLMVNVGIVLVFGAFYLRFLNVHERSRRNAACPAPRYAWTRYFGYLLRCGVGVRGFGRRKFK